MNVEKLFKEFPETKITFIDQKNNKIWPTWKAYKDCSAKEKEEANLRTIFPSEIVLDIEDKDRIEELKEQLKDFNYYMYDTGSRGIHVHLFFNNMTLDTPERSYEEVRKAVRKLFIKKYKADFSKANESGVIALENKSHFKTGNKKTLLFANENIDGSKDGYNVLDSDLNIQAFASLEKKQPEASVVEKEFEGWHEKDKFFQYIANNIIPENTNRDLFVFPNLALGLVKEGLNEEQIKELVEPILKANFPGKVYNEFRGWVKKALNKEITDFNKFLLNKWGSEQIGVKFYDDSEIAVIDKSLVEGIPEDIKKGIRFVPDKNLDEIENYQTEWIIEKWLPEGDINFLVGKASSYKTTICLHLAYAISEGKLVFNSYKTKKSKVLYLNEENSNNILLSFIKRVKKGLELEQLKSPDLFFTFMENIRLDKADDINKIIDFVKANDIKIIFCDSFRRFIGFDENNATEMNKFFNNLKIIRKKCGVTIVILHHLKKENSKEHQDVRDMLRGSSDIVNSVDSIISIKRKHGQDTVVAEHIKNRSGEELIGRVLKVDAGENKDTAYIYELKESEINKDKILSITDVCGNEIIKFLEDKRIRTFSNNSAELPEIYEKYSAATIKRALAELIESGMLITSGENKHRKYCFDLPVNKFAKEALEEDEAED